MDTGRLNQFEIDWQRSLKEPKLKVVDLKRAVDLSLGAMLDRFLLFAEKSLGQGKIPKSDYDELVAHAGNLKKVLTRIKEKDLLAADVAERAKRRELKY